MKWTNKLSFPNVPCLITEFSDDKSLPVFSSCGFSDTLLRAGSNLSSKAEADEKERQ